MDKRGTNNIKIRNKRATFEYFLVETLTAGIVLTGTEIKSIRGGKASLADSYCSFKGNELFVIGMHIAEYAQGTYNNHDPKRDRKLLLTARELRKLKNKVQEKASPSCPSPYLLMTRAWQNWTSPWPEANTSTTNARA